MGRISIIGPAAGRLIDDLARQAREIEDRLAGALSGREAASLRKRLGEIRVLLAGQRGGG